jgi:predicted RNA-binding Zn ribbon-like protein
MLIRNSARNLFATSARLPLSVAQSVDRNLLPSATGDRVAHDAAVDRCSTAARFAVFGGD